MRKFASLVLLMSLLGVAGGHAAAAASAAGPTGTLWHNGFLMTNSKLGRGVYASPLDGGAPIQILDRGEMDVAVWPDGRQFLVTRPNVYQGLTDLVVMDPATGAAIYQGRLSGHVSNVQPSPVDRRLVKVRQARDSLTPSFEEFILDLSTMQRRRRIADDDWFAWMPDGRFMLIDVKTGRMRVAGLDSPQETAVGQLVLPADRQTGAFAVSPTGRQLLMRMPLRNSVPKQADLWIANIDGSGLEQFTDAKAIGGAVWSPDGRYVAYKVDTGHACSTAGYCTGSCDQYYAPVELRRVQGLRHRPGSDNFNVRNREGRSEALGCSVIAWTP